MTSLNFDDDGQLGSMELYGLKLQKVVADFTEFDAITKKYVDDKVLQAKQELTDGASEALNTFKELEEYLEGSDTASGLVDQISALSAQITAEANRAGTAEGGLATRVSALENDTSSATGISGVQSELDATQQGAGLDLDGSYVADAARNYISDATSLKSADALLDSALKTETDRAEGIEGGLATRIATLEADPSTGASVTAVQNELDTTQQGAGLGLDGTYTSNASSNYLALAESLKDADNKLDAQAKLNSTQISSLATDTGNAILNAATQRGTINTRITNLTADDIAEGADTLYYTNQRVKMAPVHSYEYFNADREYDAPVDITVGDAFSAIKTELQGMHTKEDADDTRHTDLTASLSTVSGALTSETTTARAAEQKIQSDVNAKDSAMSGRVAVFEGQLNNGNVEGSEFYVDNLSVQGVVDDLRGAIDYVNGERFSNTNDIAGLEAKRIASDTRHDGHDTKHTAHEAKQAAHDGSISDLESTKFDKAGGEISGEVRVNLDASFFYLSDVWRIRTDAIGKRIVFEFNKDVAANEGEGDWVSGIPFISSH